MNIQMTERFNEIALTVVSSFDVRMCSPCRFYRTERNFSLEVILNFKLMVPCIIFTSTECPTRCNSMQSDLFHCKVTLHVSCVTAPIIRVIKTVTAASGKGHNIGTATSLQRGQIWPRWREVALPIL